MVLPSFMMLITFNALGLMILTGLFIGYIKVLRRHNGDLGGPFGRHRNRNDDNDGGGNGGGGIDPGLPKIDLPPGTSLDDWLTDRQPNTRKKALR
jgi:hypothetical protein